MLEQLTKENWNDYHEHSFQYQPADTDNDALTFVLVEVSGLGTKPGAEREPYSLIFRGPADPVLEQGIVPMQHPDLGEVSIFLVPIGPDSTGMCYEAVFT